MLIKCKKIKLCEHREKYSISDFRKNENYGMRTWKKHKLYRKTVCMKIFYNGVTLEQTLTCITRYSCYAGSTSTFKFID